MFEFERGEIGKRLVGAHAVVGIVPRYAHKHYKTVVAADLLFKVALSD